ncbi:MAG TPA: oxidative damage protection protein [Cellvibrionaceae bacterium]
MSRTVFCRKYQQELPGLDRPPYPGPVGQDVYENISKQAWQEWLAHQTMLINEKQLNLMDTATRVYLGEQMTKFLSGDDYDQAEGYVPPEEDK